ncbi:MAG: hypothetical protein ACXWFB_12865 [Nitrososphaeraceae archaeon]
MNKEIIPFIICTTLMSGCYVPSNYNYPDTTIALPMSTYGSPQPVFLGWDENGHKIFDSNKKTKKTGNKYLLAEDNSKSTILNEDSIICETDTPLLIFLSRRYRDLNGNIIKSTGSDLIKTANSYIKLKELDLKAEQAKQNFNGGRIFSNIELEEKKEEIEQLSEFLQACVASKETQSVEVIERKPISNITKIKAKINDKYYELWTYEYQLTQK